MYNVKMVVNPETSTEEIIKRLCLQENLRRDDHFAFSAILKRQDGQFFLQFNCSENKNSYSLNYLVPLLFKQIEVKDIAYVNAPLEDFFEVFRPMRLVLVNMYAPMYERLIPDRQDIDSILSLEIVNLYNKGYYLHKRLIKKSFLNALNKEVRKLKFLDSISLDAPRNQEDGLIVTELDLLISEEETEKAKDRVTYSPADFKSDQFEMLKEIMLEDMSEISFKRILLQLKSKTVDSRTSQLLTKYRQMLTK